MTNKKNILLVTILMLLVFLMTGCNSMLPKPTKGIITGKVLIPSREESLKDISGWIPVANAEVTMLGADGALHKAYTDNNGIFNFNNLAVKPNTIVTATVKIDGNTMVLKKIIPVSVGKEEEFDVGILTPESTALALMVERLIKDGKDIDLEKIKKAKSFENLVDEIKSVLEEHGNVINDNGIGGLIDKIMRELFPESPTPPTAPAIASYTTGKRDTDGTSTSITIPTGTQNGDLMVLIFTINGDTAPNAPTGWERLTSGSNGRKVTQAIYYRKLDASLSNFNVSHGYTLTSWILLHIPGGDIPRASTVATAQTSSPNSPSLAHGFGTGTNVLWIATAGWTKNNTVTGWPTNYNDNRYSAIASYTWGNSTAVATRTLTANSEDPGSFGLSYSSINPYWCAFALAIKHQ